MRVIVPLQGVVQGRGGLVLGSVIPCALFYFLQLYLKRHRSNSNPPTPPPSPDSDSDQPSRQLVEVPVLPRSLSRSHLSPRNPGGPIHVSGRANSVLKGGEPPYYVGLRKVSEEPYDPLGNPDGVIQLGLDENKVGRIGFSPRIVSSLELFRIFIFLNF
jgi:aminotransferase